MKNRIYLFQTDQAVNYKMKYDVIIAGGGIAGTYAARELSRSGLKTLIVDQAGDLGSTAGTTAGAVKKFHLPLQAIDSHINTVICGSLHHEKTWVSNKIIGYTLNYKKAETLLLQQAIENGAVARLDTKAISLIKDNEHIIGLKTSTGDFYADYFIDATGSAGVLISQVGLRKKIPGRPSVGLEYIVTDPNHYLRKFERAFAIYFDVDFFSFGYGWVYCDGLSTHKVGVCEDNVDPKRNLPSLDERVNRFLNFLTQGKKITIVTKDGGSIFAGDSFQKIRFQNLFGVGDTIEAANPFLGEGIRHVLYSADLAVNAIVNHYQSEASLESYEKNWFTYRNPRWQTMTVIANSMYRSRSPATQTFYDELGRFLNHLSCDEFLELAQEYRLGVVLRKFPVNLKLALAFIRSRLS